MRSFVTDSATSAPQRRLVPGQPAGACIHRTHRAATGIGRVLGDHEILDEARRTFPTFDRCITSFEESTVREQCVSLIDIEPPDSGRSVQLLGHTEIGIECGKHSPPTLERDIADLCRTLVAADEDCALKAPGSGHTSALHDEKARPALHERTRGCAGTPEDLVQVPYLWER